MANTFGILAAVVLAASAIFAVYNKKAFRDQVTLLEAQEAQKVVNERTFADERAKAVDLEERTASTQAEVVQLKGDLESQLSTNSALESEVDDKTRVADSKSSELATAKEALSQFGDLDSLKRTLEDLKTSLVTLEGELIQKNAEISSNSARKDTLESENAELGALLKRYTERVSNPGLRTTVKRVVSDLCFVILGGGDDAGVIRDSMLDVLRNGEVIGKLQVTGTEASTAAASIVPDSFGEGLMVRVGDSVVAATN